MPTPRDLVVAICGDTDEEAVPRSTKGLGPILLAEYAAEVTRVDLAADSLGPRSEDMSIKGGSGITVTLYEPVGPALCSRCGTSSDDICVEVVGTERGRIDLGFCGPCLVSWIREFAQTQASS